MREAKVTQIFEGTNQIQRLVICPPAPARLTVPRDLPAPKGKPLQINASTVALVTGGASGLGEATVRRLHADGAAVVIVDLPSSPGAALAEELGDARRLRRRPTCATRRRCRPRSTARQRARRAADRRQLRGRRHPGPRRRQARPAGARRTSATVIDINLVGTFNVLRLAAAAMLENEPVDGDRGVIVMTASIAAYDGQIGQAAYAASKGGVVGLTLSAARDLADKASAGHDGRPGHLRDADARRPAGRGDARPRGAGAAPLAARPARASTPSWSRHIVDNAMLNGEVIRLDGALRMPPR